MRYNFRMLPGELVRNARQRAGITQASLARRTGTKQSAISRLENDELSPSVQTLRLLLNAMGEDLALSVEQVRFNDDPLHHSDWQSRPPEERLRLALSWNRLAGRLEAAGRAAKNAGIRE